MIAAFSPATQSILDLVARPFGWELCISTGASSRSPYQHGYPRFFSWVHDRNENGLDHEFWGLGLYIIASRDR